tara:strand:+ start:8532 stop:9386 length:855 start_codon:yes stop_codon:yes gene_type:complete
MRNINKIVGIGDSWTFGEGSFSLTLEEKLKMLKSEPKNILGMSKEYSDFCSSGSWVTQLASMYKCDYEIYAIPGCSNETIMNNVHRCVTENIADKDTLVIVMWSSKFRDRIFALPSYEKDGTSDRWMFKSEEMILNQELWHKFIESGNPDQSLFKKFKRKFIAELFKEEILDYYTMCYKIYSQFLLEERNIPYVMCNGFEKQIPKTSTEKDIIPYDSLNTKCYYKPNSSMMEQLIKEDNHKDLWEAEYLIAGYVNGQHPNFNGYTKIAQYLKEFIEKNDKHIFV